MNDETADEECKFKRHLGAIVFRSNVHINEIISIHVSFSLSHSIQFYLFTVFLKPAKNIFLLTL